MSNLGPNKSVTMAAHKAGGYAPACLERKIETPLMFTLPWMGTCRQPHVSPLLHFLESK